MKKLFWLPFVILLAALLTACGEPEAEPETEAVYYTVTFCDAGLILDQRQVEEGAYPEMIPENIPQWVDEHGKPTDPAETAIWADRTFRAASSVEMTGTHLLVMDAENGCFDPDGTVSRAEAAGLMLGLLVEQELPEVTVTLYTDLDTDDAYYDAVRTVSAFSLMEGYPNGSFRPDDAITRAEFASILYMLSGEYTEASSGFEDVSSDHWAANAIACCKQAGWLSGYPDNRFYPDAPLTRACAAAAVANIRGLLLEPAAYDIACGGESPFSDVPTDHWAYYAILDAAYTNELIDYAGGRAENVEPGFLFLEDQMCYVNPETMRLELFNHGFRTIGDGLYYIEEDGWFIKRFESGLTEFLGGMYFVPEDDGPFLTDDSFGYLYFGEDGRYTSGSEIVDSYVETILSEIPDFENMTKDEQLYAAYCSIRDGGYRYRRASSGWQRGTTSWTQYAAEVMYETKGGSCYYWAASFLYLARRLGYQAYAVCGGVGTRNQIHAWVVIEWPDDGEEYICDVELEWAYINHFYDVTYSTTDMYKQPLDATNVVYWFPDGTVTNGYSGSYVAADNSSTPIEVPDSYFDDDPFGPEDPEVPEDLEDPENPADPEDPNLPENPDDTDNPGGDPGGDSGGDSGGDNPGGDPGGNPGGDSGGNSGGDSGGNSGGDPGGNPGGDGGNTGDAGAEPAE